MWQFHKDVAAGALPAYALIEPQLVEKFDLPTDEEPTTDDEAWGLLQRLGKGLSG